MTTQPFGDAVGVSLAQGWPRQYRNLQVLIDLLGNWTMGWFVPLGSTWTLASGTQTVGLHECWDLLGASDQLAGQFGHTLPQHFILITKRQVLVFQSPDPLIRLIHGRSYNVQFRFKMAGLKPVELHLAHDLVVTLG